MRTSKNYKSVWSFGQILGACRSEKCSPSSSRICMTHILRYGKVNSIVLKHTKKSDRIKISFAASRIRQKKKVEIKRKWLPRFIRDVIIF